jgi:hypothetical protein
LILIFSFSYYYVTLFQITPPLPEPLFPLPDLPLPSSLLTQLDWTQLTLTGPDDRTQPNPTTQPDWTQLDLTGLLNDPAQGPNPARHNLTQPDVHGTVSLLKDEKSE